MTVYGQATPTAPVFDEAARQYDAVLVMSFGGPEGHDDVMPFLEQVAGGRNIPRARLETVAEHYYDMGGVSPINGQNRALIAALQVELHAHDLHLPVYFGNRNWHPFIEDTIRQMRDDGVERVITFFTSAFSSYSGCRQYREDIIRAAEAVGEGAPVFDRLRMFYNHPGFIGPVIERAQVAMAKFTPEERDSLKLVFSAHSIPLAMAQHSDYEAELQEACRLVADGLDFADYELVYQSRSGPPHVPWLEPDICDALKAMHSEQDITNVLLVPIGFISDHMEVLFD
ncbi:MAG: ferrochelatase, partial [Anaerolineae bacterium]|nr:ferrochelatase [Anaerolineae bacterium]